MKKLFLDLETTGTNPNKDAIHTVAVIMQIKGEVVERKVFTMSPDYMGPLDPDDLTLLDALALTSSNLDDLLAYEKAHIVAREFINFLGRHLDLQSDKDKCFFIAFNAKFDFDFFMAWMKHACTTSYVFQNIYTPPICVLSKAADAFKVIRPKFPNFKLTTIAKLFDLELEAHNPESDIEVARQIYNRLEAATTIDYDNI